MASPYWRRSDSDRRTDDRQRVRACMRASSDGMRGSPGAAAEVFVLSLQVADKYCSQRKGSWNASMEVATEALGDARRE